MTHGPHPDPMRQHTHSARRIMIVEKLGRQLKQARHALHLSQEEVAARAGIGVQAYGSLERGWKPNGEPVNPTLDTLIRVHNVLHLLPDEEEPSGSIPP